MKKCCVWLRAPKGSEIVWGMNPQENGHVEGRTKLIESMDKSAVLCMPVPCQYNVATVSWNASS